MQPTTPLRVLLVHRPDDASRLHAVLEAHGAARVTTAVTTARAARQAFDPTRHDVVVADGSSPGADGVELVRALRTDHPDVRAVVVLDDALPPAVAGAVHAGAAGVVVRDSLEVALGPAVVAVCSGICALDRGSAGVLAASWPPDIEGLLSAREMDVLECLSLGLTNAQVGATLYVSRETVKTHVAHLLRKLDVGDRTAAVIRARHLGLLPRGAQPTTLLA